MAVTDAVFVYGTLRAAASHPMARLLEAHACLEGRAWLAGRLYDLGPYPAAVPDVLGRERVVGDLYRMKRPGLLLPELDRYEGCMPEDPQPHEYRREQHRVVLSDGGVRMAWVYVYNRAVPLHARISSGDYLNP